MTRRTLLAGAVALLLVGLPHRSPAQDITTGLMGYYAFDEGSGTTALDSSPSPNNGTFQGTPSRSCTKINGCLTFTSASSQAVLLPNVAKLNITGGAITLAAWVQTSSTVAQLVIGGYQSGSPNAGYGLGIGVVAAGRIDHWNGSSWNSSTGTVHDGTWHHIAAVVSGTSLTFYRDAVANGTATSSATSSFAGQRAIGALSSGGGSSYFNGSIDEVRIYNRALTLTDIQALRDFTGTASVSRKRLPLWFNAVPRQDDSGRERCGAWHVMPWSRVWCGR